MLRAECVWSSHTVFTKHLIFITIEADGILAFQMRKWELEGMKYFALTHSHDLRR